MSRLLAIFCLGGVSVDSCLRHVHETLGLGVWGSGCQVDGRGTSVLGFDVTRG